MTEEEKNKNIDDLNQTIDKLEDDLEKKITYTSAGALALSITFLEKIVDFSLANHFWLLILGWLLLALTLGINLIKTLLSRRFTMLNLIEIKKDSSDVDLPKRAKRRNNINTFLDLTSLISLILGIFCVIVFCSINVSNKKNSISEKKETLEVKIVEPLPNIKINCGQSCQTPQDINNSKTNNKGNTAPNSRLAIWRV